MTTLRELATSSMRLLSIIQAGVAPSPADLNVVVAALNSLLDSWSADRLAIFAMYPSYFQLKAGKRDYTLGPAGFNPDWVMERPQRLERASLSYNAVPAVPGVPAHLSTNSTDFPITIMYSPQFSTIAMKGCPSNWPSAVYDNGQYPTRKLTFWPVPTQDHLVTLWIWRPLVTSTDLDAIIQFPPGYERALRFNLAVEVAAEFGKQLPEQVQSIATTSFGDLKRLNAAGTVMSCPSWAGGKS